MGARDVGPRVSCILPAYNEADSVGPTVAEWAAVLEPAVARIQPGLACLRLGRRLAPPARRPAPEEVAAAPAAFRSEDVATPQSLAR